MTSSFICDQVQTLVWVINHLFVSIHKHILSPELGELVIVHYKPQPPLVAVICYVPLTDLRSVPKRYIGQGSLFTMP